MDTTSSGISGMSAKDILGPTPLVEIENEAPAKLIVDPPLPEQLAEGRVYIQYRTENLRIVSVFGEGALSVSPRVGHLHITVDDAPCTSWMPAAKPSLSSDWNRVPTRYALN